MGKGYVHASHSCYAIYTSRNRVAKWKPSEGGRTAQKPLYIKEIISYIRRFLTNERYSWEALKLVKVRKRFAMCTELCVFYSIFTVDRATRTFARLTAYFLEKNYT